MQLKNKKAAPEPQVGDKRKAQEVKRTEGDEQA